jgi:hypothetical protein
VIEVDPRIEQTFADVLARSRQRAADITERVAAKERELAEQSERIKREGQELTKELDRRVAERLEAARNNPWQRPESKPTVLAFGGEDEEGRKPATSVASAPPISYPPAPPPPAPEPEPAPAAEQLKRYLSFDVEDEEVERPRPVQPQQPPRPAARDDEDDEDYFGQSWVR